jgi:hypothetical protein
MNLIANSGIQLFTFPVEINLNDNFKMYFHEWYDVEDNQLKLEIAQYFSDEDVWVKKYDLSILGYAVNGKVTESWENIREDFSAEGKKEIRIETNDPRDSGCFQQSIGRINLEKFENLWLPLPFFSIHNNTSGFGPTNWCRFKLIAVDDKNKGSIKQYHLVLAFDTKSEFEKESFEDEDLNESPIFTSEYERSKTFAICNDEYKLISYCYEEFGCDWIDKYLLKIFHNLDNINDYKGQKPKMDYLAQYIFLVRYIQQLNILPKVTLYSNKNIPYGDVDLVVDIGNSRTCAVLFDNSDFTKMSPLELQDFTTIVSNGELNKYRDSFDMRLAFREADFGGKFGIENSRQFVYPSMIRLGKEANRLIHKATNMNTGAEKTSTFSSPKRFLWDTKPRKQEWEFVQLDGEIAKPIYIEGISEQLNNDGSLNIRGDGGILMQYSRRALMTFAFLEIIAQANMQINSFEQRNHWGEASKPRKISRIIVTCPTAMSRVEQTSLRKCAEDAAIMLDRFFKNEYRKQIEERAALEKVQVVPSSKNLSLKGKGVEWIYDEATAAQFVFLYAEINQRYLKNVDDYFNLYGKVRNDLKGYNKKSLTIGSVDIGAGTTDVMIAAYKYDDPKQCKLTPVPLFWESFYEAGDDLLKRLVQQLVLEGRYSPIEKKLQDLGKNPVELMQPFLGTDVGVSFRNRQLRSDFNLQVSVPVVSHFLELLKENKVESKILSFGDIFGTNLPTSSVLNHFKQHFGFELESLQWQYEQKVVAAIVEKTFNSLTGKISSLLSYHDCDIVLLSGRPTSLKPLTDLFLKHYAISPSRLKSMNDYRVGRWYPEDQRHKFIDGNGKFINPKSIITTGAMIGHIADNGGMNGFSLNLKELKEKLLPNTHYFGRLNEQLSFTETIISPEVNLVTVEVVSLPFRIGVRQLDTAAYPSRPFYTFDFDEYAIEDRIKGRLDDENDHNAVQVGVNAEKAKIKRKMPLRVTIERDTTEDIELLRIGGIEDNEGNSLSPKFFSLQVQSMSELENFWLDSGIFSLNINK